MEFTVQGRSRQVEKQADVGITDGSAMKLDKTSRLLSM